MLTRNYRVGILVYQTNNFSVNLLIFLSVCIQYFFEQLQSIFLVSTHNNFLDQVRLLFQATFALTDMLENTQYLNYNNTDCHYHTYKGHFVEREEETERVNENSKQQQPPVLANLLYCRAHLVTADALADFAGSVDGVPHIHNRCYCYKEVAYEYDKEVDCDMLLGGYLCEGLSQMWYHHCVFHNIDFVGKGIMSIVL